MMFEQLDGRCECHSTQILYIIKVSNFKSSKSCTSEFESFNTYPPICSMATHDANVHRSAYVIHGYFCLIGSKKSIPFCKPIFPLSLFSGSYLIVAPLTPYLPPLDLSYVPALCHVNRTNIG